MTAVDPQSALAAPERFPCFDGLRALAAGGVLLLHVSFISGYIFRSEDSLGPYLARGEVGVTLFFLLSGYLLYRPFVAARFDHAPGPGLRSYARRRLLRIVPAYWIALTILVVILDSRERNDISSLGDAVVYYGFLQIYFEDTVVGGLQQAWSLCTEISFYAFLPVWVLAMRSTRRSHESNERTLTVELAGLAALFTIGIVARWVVVNDLPSGYVDVDRRLDWLLTNTDLFALGMALAVVREWALRRRRPPPVLEFVGRVPSLWWGLAALSYWAVSTRVGLPLGPGAHTPGQWMARQLLYASTAFFLLLPAVFGPQDQGAVRRVLRAPVVAGAGLISYGIYLWHEGVLDLWMRARDLPAFFSDFAPLLAVTVTGTVAAATVSYVLVERPALARKR